MICYYCDDEAVDILRISDAVYDIHKVMIKAPVDAHLCQMHYQQLSGTLMKQPNYKLDHPKRAVRPKEMVGQTTIDDYLI